MSGTIFISYRRGMDSGFAGRLYDRLEQSFERQRVFIDVDSIVPGDDFVAVIEAWVAECDVLLALIGHGWLTATDSAGHRRLDNPDDFVRIEIAAALAQGKRVIPVLTDDVTMPQTEELPEEIKPLVRRHAIRLTHERFKDDVGRLVRALERALASLAEARLAEEEASRQVEEEARRVLAKMLFAQEPSPAPERYVSYAWGDDTAEGKKRQKIVEDLCAAAEAKGIKILRDKDEIGLGERISKFMRRLGQGDRVFIVLSDKYLKSPFCMYELSEVWRNSRQDEEEFLKRIRVYTMPDAKIGALKDRLAYAIHWRQQYAEVDALVKEHGNDILGEKGWQDYRRMKQFAGNVTDILTTVSDILQPRSFDELVRYGFDKDFSKPDGDGSHLRVIADFAVFRDIDARWCPEMVALPAGEFLMGSPMSEEGRDDSEGPQHQVTIGYRFAIGRYPVTFAEYDHFCDVTKREKPEDEGRGRGRQPVINVSWYDAQAYCDWLAKETGKPYRLPSEAEWEYACRAGTTRPFSIGKTITEKDANFGWNVGKTTKVGSFPTNPWGLYDMHGNVREWCADHWHDNYVGAPADGSASIIDAGGTGAGAERVLRGGAWNSGAQTVRHYNFRHVRSASRDAVDPGSRNDGIGFRCVRVLS